ncbi:MAG: YdcH family protein [Acidobacteria bacterium]|nr:YdcH family protein [Acidobacteriota bacterium]
MNAAEAQEVKSLLLQSHDHYRQLAEQHSQLDHRLHELADKHYLTASEQVEQVTLKKRKLALKDQMEQIAREYAGRV